MDLDQLKSNWEQVGSGKKSQDQLLMMTKLKNHPQIKRMRLRFAIEGIFLLLFTAGYYDGFDGVDKPLWVNILLVVTAISYILTRLSGWLLLKNSVKMENLKVSLIGFQSKLKRMVISVVTTTLLFGFTVISFFSVSVDFTKSKYVIVAGMMLLLVAVAYASAKDLNQKIGMINKTLADFN